MLDTLALGLFALALVAGGCSNEFGETCGVPGLVLACACDDGSSGVLTCEASGDSGPCQELDQDGQLVICRAADLQVRTGGGANGDGDAPGTGGAAGGGTGASGGNIGTGGNVGSGGIDGSGGNIGTGGNMGTGGDVGSGGTPSNPNVVPGAWASCTAAADCPQGYSCRGTSGTGAGSYCSAPCQGDPSACPPPPTGNATPACQFLGPLGFTCLLDCGGGATCPDGMTCGSNPFAGATSCGWP